MAVGGEARNGLGDGAKNPSVWRTPLVALGFFALAGYFHYAAPAPDIPPAATPPFRREVLSTAPRRKHLGDPPIVRVNGFERDCRDCHQIFPPTRRDPKPRLLQHPDVRLDHGPNRRCRVCHHPTDRNFLLDGEGGKLPFARSTELCGRCHVTIREEWGLGLHGRTNGYWDRRRGPVRRLECVECHDPHDPSSPAMDPIQPLPAPHTLRMGNPAQPTEEYDPRSVLARVLGGER